MGQRNSRSGNSIGKGRDRRKGVVSVGTAWLQCICVFGYRPKGEGKTRPSKADAHTAARSLLLKGNSV